MAKLFAQNQKIPFWPILHRNVAAVNIETTYKIWLCGTGQAVSRKKYTAFVRRPFIIARTVMKFSQEFVERNGAGFLATFLLVTFSGCHLENAFPIFKVSRLVRVHTDSHHNGHNKMIFAVSDV